MHLFQWQIEVLNNEESIFELGIINMREISMQSKDNWNR